MEGAVRVAEGVQTVLWVHQEFIACDENGAGCANRKVAFGGSDSAGSHSGRGVVAGARGDERFAVYV